MYTKHKERKTTLKINQGFVGESIEQKIHRILHNNEPIKDGAPLIYTERKDGVDPAMDIRTDRFDVALGATDYITRSNMARREAKIVEMHGAVNPETGKREKPTDSGNPSQ